MVRRGLAVGAREGGRHECDAGQRPRMGARQIARGTSSLGKSRCSGSGRFPSRRGGTKSHFSLRSTRGRPVGPSRRAVELVLCQFVATVVLRLLDHGGPFALRDSPETVEGRFAPVDERWISDAPRFFSPRIGLVCAMSAAQLGGAIAVLSGFWYVTDAYRAVPHWLQGASSPILELT